MASESIIIRCRACGGANRVKSECLHLGPVCGRCKASLPPPWVAPVYITDNTFNEEVIDSPLPALVDFWSTRCRPCAEMSPVLDQIAHEMAGKLKVCKIDIDKNRSSAARFGINAVPTFLIFRGGLLLDTIRGAMPKEAILGRVSRFLKS